MSVESELLTIPEIAARLRCTEWHVARLIRAGRIEATKPAKCWLATPEAIEAYKASMSNAAPARRRRRRAS